MRTVNILHTDCDWMALHQETLFTFDELGRMSARREPGRPPPPRFHLGRTRHGNIWRFGEREDSKIVTLLARYAGKERLISELSTVPPAPERIAAIRETLETGAGIRAEWRGPAYRFLESLASIASTSTAGYPSSRPRVRSACSS